MSDNYLITGYCGVPHVTVENDRGINAGIFGVGRYVLPVGKQFMAENIGNNTIRIYDGKLVDNGAAAGIPAGEYIDLFISNASQGMNRNDLIVFQYSQDPSTLIESGTFVVVQGAETSGTAVDPVLTQEDLLSDRATFDQMALWRIPVSTGAISTPVQLFELSKTLDKAGAGIQTVVATSTDGMTYIAEVEDIEELYAGLTVTIIPNRVSASATPKLNVNGLGNITIRRPLSSNTATSLPSSDVAWMAANKPVTMQYNGTYWLTVLPMIDPIDLNGAVPVEKGGTGLNTVTDGNFLVGKGNDPMKEMTPAEVVKHIGAAKFELIWENASPTSSFGGQVLTIKTDCTVLAIVTNNGTHFISTYGDHAQAMGINHVYTNEYGTSFTFVGRPTFVVSAQNGTVKIEFESAYVYHGTNASVTASNSYLIPRAIYGVYKKG